MKRSIAHVLTGALLGAVVLVAVGCLERTEKITVAADGSAHIEVQIKGDAQALDGPQAFPAAPEWTIVEDRIDTTDNKLQMILRAERDVPYGLALPESFARRGSANYDLDLLFPTSITVRTEGNRTYYEFRRSYTARRFAAFDLTGIPMLWDKELEERVLDTGLVNASENDRRQYLGQLTQALAYRFWRMNREALAHLVQKRVLEPALMDSVATRAAAQFDETITPDFLYGVMQGHDETIALTLDSLEQAASGYFESALRTVAGRSGDALSDQFAEALELIKKEYRIAEMISGQEFAVELQLPGTILTSNGVVEVDEQGKVNWFFKGEDLHDADFPIYALSVVTR